MKHLFVRNLGIHLVRQTLVASAVALALVAGPVCTPATAVDPQCVDLLKQFLSPAKGPTAVAPDLAASSATCIDLRGTVGAGRLAEVKSAPSGKLVVVDQQTLRNPSLVDSLAKSRAHLCFATPRSVGAVQALLAAEVKKPKFFALVPSHPEEIRAVWNLPPDQDVSLIARQMAKAKPEWEKVSDAIVFGGQLKMS